MKTNKTIIAFLATGLILSLGVSSTLAYGGNGQGMGNGQGQGQGMGQGQNNQDGSGKQSNKQNMKGSHNPGDYLENISLQDLSESEKEMLYYGYSEELLARDMYNYFYELYGNQTFKNIADSEQEHMDAVKVLLDRYGLDKPSDYGELADEYETLKKEGSKGLKEALEVGVNIEILDIDDIRETIKNTDNDDFKIIFSRIGGASYNHMRGFLKALNNAGYETDIDYSSYLTENDLDSKGPINYKLAESLEQSGISLPETATSTYLKENCQQATTNENMGQGSKNQNNSINNAKGNQTNNYNSSLSLRNKYKQVITEKYQEKINALSEDKLSNLIVKIDELSLEINNSTKYSTNTKANFIAMLDVLKDLSLQKLGETELDLDSLFE